MTTFRHLTDEQLIDYSLGNLPKFDSHKVQEHLQDCKTCQEKWREWQQVLNVEGKGDGYLNDELREQIWQSVEKRQNRKWQFSIRGVWQLSVAVVVCFFIIAFVFLNDLKDSDRKLLITHNDEIQATNFLKKPNTEQLHIIPVQHSMQSDPPLQGNIWINDATRELLLEVDGLVEMNNYDYQLWIIFQDNEVLGAIIPTINGSSRMFIQGMDVQNFIEIKASLEPKGGSIVPTGPDTFFVEIRR
ncbi:hypothetical protein [Bacillus kwashiorkori]|uniref:hypothetical protein n=1 Tax=Bacillus kwashiorkori TaxID=1522318 RepID=UPI000784536D|nr:hypothetical protein [Bacillus kwashiorkori]